MKTTPKPRATKKSKGELVGPPPPELAGDVVAAGEPVEVADGMVLVDGEDAILETVWCEGMAQLSSIEFFRLAIIQVTMKVKGERVKG